MDLADNSSALALFANPNASPWVLEAKRHSLLKKIPVKALEKSIHQDDSERAVVLQEGP
jgi:hypothetical protein